MCDDVLCCARVESDGDRTPSVYVAVPTAPHAATHAVKHNGTSHNRIAARHTHRRNKQLVAARTGTARSFPGLGWALALALGLATLLGNDRLGLPTFAHPLAIPTTLATAAAATFRLRAMSAVHASRHPGPPADTPHCNYETGDSGA